MVEQIAYIAASMHSYLCECVCEQVDTLSCFAVGIFCLPSSTCYRTLSPCDNNSKSHSDGPTVCCLQTGGSVHRDVYSCFPLGGLTVRSRRVHQVRTSLLRLFVAFHDCTVLTYANVCSRMLTYAHVCC
jgi:hypothetical protein